MPAPFGSPQLLVHHPSLVAGEDPLIVAADGRHAAHRQFLAALQIGAGELQLAAGDRLEVVRQGRGALGDEEAVHVARASSRVRSVEERVRIAGVEVAWAEVEVGGERPGTPGIGVDGGQAARHLRDVVGRYRRDKRAELQIRVDLLVVQADRGRQRPWPQLQRGDVLQVGDLVAAVLIESLDAKEAGRPHDAIGGVKLEIVPPGQRSPVVERLGLVEMADDRSS